MVFNNPHIIHNLEYDLLRVISHPAHVEILNFIYISYKSTINIFGDKSIFIK